ncbi:hypothetical protein [Solimicrobium silvestre]|uniref:hypothetical protein n=1 Tax=Solimicrobium silvestre TaxID=2099400 RepID=UPI000CFD2468|nr:hypothetical protein [Solimicrobium silvestre]
MLWGADKIKEGLNGDDKPVPLGMPTGGEVKLKSGFFISLLTLDPAAELVSYKGPLFVAVGTKDTIVFPQPAIGQSLIKYHH